MAAAVSLVSMQTFAAPGDLDNSFGSGFGRVRTVFGGSLISYYQTQSGDAWGQPSITIQSNGKIIVAAGCKSGATYDLCVVRYEANGNLDASFGVAGITTIDMRGTDDNLAGVAVQADGKIVVAGSCDATGTSGTGADFCVVRLNANGTLDASFATGGKVFTSVRDFDDTATGVALQADGKIVVAGFCAASASTTMSIEDCVVRYTSGGVLDTSFSGDGRLIVRPSGVVIPVTVYGRANSLVIAADGKIVVAGSSTTFPDANLRIARILPNGTLDTSFSTDGIVTVSPASGWIVAQSVAIQPDGQLLVAGTRVGGCGGPSQCVMAMRFTDAGVPDTAFGNAGTVLIDGSAIGFYLAHSVALQSDGKILLSGYASIAGEIKFAYARLHGDGTVDQSFASNGIGTTGFDAGNTDFGFGVVIQPDGKILQVGACFGPTAFCVARYEGGAFGARNCSLDIDGDGRVLATTDMLIGTRVALGVTGAAVINGITFAANAARDEWGTNGSRDIRKYLVTQCGMSLP